MKRTIKPLVIVEGKYDKIKLENLMEGLIISTEGFGIFKDRQAQQTIRTLAEGRGAVILTDSDRAGFIIRKRLHDLLAGCKVYDLYIPDVFGKERRKEKAGAEGKLGVEGIPDKMLMSLLEQIESASRDPKSAITEVDLYERGLFGGEGSQETRRAFQAWLGFPSRLNKNMLLKILCDMFTKEQFFAQWQRFQNEKDPH